MYRMMIVDDEERIVNSIYDLMEERFDFELYRCYSAVQAIALLKKMRFDIIISDISMPQMSGLELLKEAKGLWPKCHFLILTAYNNFEYAYQTLKYDRVDYLLKIESYDEICNIIEKKRARIEQERQEEEKLLHVNNSLHNLHQTMRGYFLKRIIVQGTPVPEQSDLDAIGLNLKLDKPVFLVLGMLNTKDPVERGSIAANIDEYVNNQFTQYDMQSFLYVSSSYLVFAIQNSSITDQPLSTMIVYAHTVFETLPQIIEDQTGHQLALLCADHFVSFSDIHTVYRQAAVHLENLRNQSGMMIMLAQDEALQPQHHISFPNIEEMNLLWEMIKCSNTSAFSDMLYKGLADLNKDETYNVMLPQASSYAVGYLLLEAAKLYAPHYTEKPSFRDIIAVKGYTHGQRWVEDVIKVVEEMLDERSTSQQKRGIWLVERIQQYTEQNYAQDLTLSDLAEKFHYSPSYLSRFYKMSTGVNLMSYIYNVRITHAKMLLCRTNLKISDIAAQTGFCSAKYFNRVFKKTVGIPASQFRQEKI